ncbi:MAG: 2-amino-4-hydroxy-6-hydroxymethyldihydropteridine diphosphokinase [Paracoccaceae bacterium]
MRQFQHVLVAFGSNLPVNAAESAEIIRSAATSLSGHGMVIRRMSRLFASPCFPAGAGPDYVNAAALVEVREGAAEVLARLHIVEAQFGRVREQRWGQRVLDLDLLAFEDQVHPDAATQAEWRNLPLAEQKLCAPEQLILPHPRLQDRAFVLVPLADVAPDWRHPLLGLTVTQMLARLQPADIAAVTPI